MIIATESVAVLNRTKELAFKDYERRIDDIVIGGIAKMVFLERMRSRQVLTRKPKSSNAILHHRTCDQVRRTGRAIGKPLCCGEPRRLYAINMLKALGIILHRKGLL